MSEPNSDCPEEKRSHGNSPFGSVKDSESVVRFVLLSNKKSVDNSRLLDSAFTIQDFLERDGWSLVRDCVGEIPVALAKYANEKGMRVEDYGYAVAQVADIRKILDDMQRRAICVIDDPQPDNPAHALAQKAREYSKLDARKIRDDLLQQFSEVLTINSV